MEKLCLHCGGEISVKCPTNLMLRLNESKLGQFFQGYAIVDYLSMKGDNDRLRATMSLYKKPRGRHRAHMFDCKSKAHRWACVCDCASETKRISRMFSGAHLQCQVSVCCRSHPAGCSGCAWRHSRTLWESTPTSCWTPRRHRQTGRSCSGEGEREREMVSHAINICQTTKIVWIRFWRVLMRTAALLEDSTSSCIWARADEPECKQTLMPDVEMRRTGWTHPL